MASYDVTERIILTQWMVTCTLFIFISISEKLHRLVSLAHWQTSWIRLT